MTTAAAAIPVKVRPLPPSAEAGSPVGGASSSTSVRLLVSQSVTEAYGSEACAVSAVRGAKTSTSSPKAST
ncbi:hypothetical protein [Streptomyces sp. WAC 05379]|uniref:hypothetical protein n=1 Tax=Streptomyces sp. WAC 05379 TaxID=2203207 RepID=UPI0021ADDE09|nr:hypothetical protein [Streptomyces sp. WAC 05379]